MATKHYLSFKLGTYLRRLELEYERSNRPRLREIINCARVAVKEETYYDNWNGGTYQHDVFLFLPPEVMKKIPFHEQTDLCQQLLADLNTCANAVDNESFRAVILELVDEADPFYQQAVPFTQQPDIDPDTLSIWQPNSVRLFISHKDNYKAEARCLATALATYGVSAFVAHDTIEPMSTWQAEIEKGLETMEIMLAFVTDDFHQGPWTNQEIGYALGKRVPIIALKLQTSDPEGFIGTKQALRGDLEAPEASASTIYKLLAEKLGQRARLQQPLISAFVASPNFMEAKARFDIMKSTVTTLSGDEFARIKEGFLNNDQLHNCIYLTNHYHRLQRFLAECTGKTVEIVGNDIRMADAKLDEEIPF